MRSDKQCLTVAELQAEGVLLVEDGNHGEYRPRPDEFVSAGVAFIRAADLDGGQVLFDKADCINEKAMARIRKGIGRPGDVLLSHKGTVGKVSLAPDDSPPYVCSPQTTFWRVLNPNRIDRHYLFAYLRSPAFHAQLASRKGETDMAPYVSLTAQRQLEVVVPDICVQRHIGAIVSAFDARISLLRQTNNTLESIAQALFKSWFIDFDPVRAKAKGREPEGMDPDTAALFPDGFDESALTLIPKAWKVRSLDSFATYLNGLALQKYPPESDEEFLPVIKIAQLRAGNTIGADHASSHLKREYVVHDGDVLFSWSGSLEVEFWCGGEGALNQHLFKVTSQEVPKWFYYLATRHFLPHFREIAAHKATTMGHIQRKHLTEAKLAVPPPDVMEGLGRLIGPLLDRRVVNELQAWKLVSLRDTLLPRLISGELRLPEAQEQLEEAAA